MKHQKQDLIDVSGWMNTTVDKLELTMVWEPIEKFVNSIKSMYDTYEKFPEDAKRTKKILNQLKSGNEPFPMYVEKDDPDNFVMEGRHRMVAFFLYGMDNVPVCYVSIKDKLDESIIKVPQHWIDKIADSYMSIAKYAYIEQFSETDEERDEMVHGLSYYGNPDSDGAIFRHRNKPVKITEKITLRDNFNATYIKHDIPLTLAAKYDTETGNMGSFRASNQHGNILIVNIASPVLDASFRGFDYASTVNELNDSIKQIIEHELTHIIQHEFHDTRQLKKNKNYHTSHEEYHKSPTEFNAQIITFVREFETKVQRLKEENKDILGYNNLLVALYKSLGDVKREQKETGNRYMDRKIDGIIHGLITPNEFMRTLRDEKPKQWKRAVKSIIKHFDRTIKKEYEK